MNLSALITALGGRDALQQLLQVGPSAISNYLTKGHLPKRAKPLIYAALTKKGYKLSADSLEILATPAGRTTSGPRILLIVSGGIAAYKALETARRLIDRGAHVTGVMTQSAKEFISPLSLAALTGEKCYDSLFSLTDEAEMGHINLARGADLVLVVPATANFIARAATGLADDLATNLDQADAVYCRIRSSIDSWIEQEGLDAPMEAAYSPCWQPSPMEDPGIDLSQQPLASVIWCTGYRSDFSWIDAPVFDGSGNPSHDRGVTQSAGLYFIGLPWLHTWGSGRFCGVSDDARYLGRVISLRLQRRDASQERLECTALLGS